jgi:hypothetical protein
LPPPKTVIRWDFGGLIHEYVERWSQISAQGGNVEVVGMCASACTLVLAYIPKEKLCFGKYASLKFHQARNSFNDPDPAPEATQWMIEKYPADIQTWIADQGKGRRTQSPLPYYLNFWWTLPADELWRMGYSKCND